MEDRISRQIMTDYIDALVARAPYGQFFADDVVFTFMGEGVEVTGRDQVEQFIIGFHTQAFDARPVVSTLFVSGTHAALEARFVGVHTGDFLGVPATGRSVDVPYSVIYDLDGGKIKHLRFYMPTDVLLRQIGALPTAEPAAV